MHMVRPIRDLCLLSPLGVYCIFYFILFYFIKKKKLPKDIVFTVVHI